MHRILIERDHAQERGDTFRVVRRGEPTLPGAIVNTVGCSDSATHARVAFGPYADMAPDDRRRIIAAFPVALDDLEIYRPAPDMSRYNAPDAPKDSREFIVWETFDTMRIMVRGGLQPSVAAEKLRSLARRYGGTTDALDIIEDAHDMYCDWITDQAVSLGL